MLVKRNDSYARCYIGESVLGSPVQGEIVQGESEAKCNWAFYTTPLNRIIP